LSEKYEYSQSSDQDKAIFNRELHTKSLLSDASIVHTPESFATLLETLEMMPYRNVNLSVYEVRKSLEIAKSLNVEDLIIRTQLIHADIMGRQGKIAEGGRKIRTINKWALDHNHHYLLARSHRLLAAFYRRIGDSESALENAVIGFKYLPEDASLPIRADHLMTLALTLDEVGAYEDSVHRFQEVLEIATNTNDFQISMFVLNNMAYTHYERENIPETLKLIDQMRELSVKHKVPLEAQQLDTIAVIEIQAGRPEEAEKTLKPLLDEPVGRRKLGELATLPECLLTVAKAQRLQGKLHEAEKTLNEAAHISEEHGLGRLSVKVRLERSEWYAASNRYQEAYEEHRMFFKENETLRSTQRETRARILQIVYDAEEAKRDSEYFKEMALRDPLTGLHNRRFMDVHMNKLLERCIVLNQPLTVAMIDLDFFKLINDTLSHEVGDIVLVHVAKILSLTIPSLGAVARIGGEEFVAVFPETDLKQGRVYANMLCEAIRSADWSPITGNLPVTASIGIATITDHAQSSSELLAIADHYLYEAKKAGRNQVICGEDISKNIE